jgi:hypothetical protein
MSFVIQTLTRDNIPNWRRQVFLWRDDHRRWVIADQNSRFAIDRYLGHPELAYTHWCYFEYPPEPM